ncbi:MAG: sortase [Ilumatobacteraceae bacterium]
MTECSPSSNRVARLLIAGLFAIGVGSIAVASSQTPASAAACQGCVVLSAPAIGLSATAQPGQQAVIDQEGGVAVYTPLTTGNVGGPGTMWLVGHRTTHGAVFNRVPTLVPGDVIDLIDDAGAHRYVVNRLLVVSESDWASHVNIHDTSRSVLILQTSHPESRLRYLVEAFGIGIAPAPIATTPATATPTAVPPPVAATGPAIAAPTVAALQRTTKFGSIKSVV